MKSWAMTVLMFLTLTVGANAQDHQKVFTAEEQGDIRCYLYAIQNAVPARRQRNGWMNKIYLTKTVISLKTIQRSKS